MKSVQSENSRQNNLYGYIVAKKISQHLLKKIEDDENITISRNRQNNERCFEGLAQKRTRQKS